MLIFEVVGFAGAALVLGAYWLLVKRGVSKTYHCMNAAGAIGIIVNSAVHFALPSVLLNVAWVAIALKGLAGPRTPVTPT